MSNMDPAYHEVLLRDGSILYYDEIHTKDRYWLSCWLKFPDGQLNEIYPSDIVRRWTREYGETSKALENYRNMEEIICTQCPGNVHIRGDDKTDLIGEIIEHYYTEHPDAFEDLTEGDE